MTQSPFSSVAGQHFTADPQAVDSHWRYQGAVAPGEDQATADSPTPAADQRSSTPSIRRVSRHGLSGRTASGNSDSGTSW